MGYFIAIVVGIFLLGFAVGAALLFLPTAVIRDLQSKFFGKGK